MFCACFLLIPCASPWAGAHGGWSLQAWADAIAGPHHSLDWPLRSARAISSWHCGLASSCAASVSGRLGGEVECLNDPLAGNLRQLVRPPDRLDGRRLEQAV